MGRDEVFVLIRPNPLDPLSKLLVLAGRVSRSAPEPYPVPALVRKHEANDRPDPGAPGRTNAGRLPVGSIVRAAGAPRIVHERMRNRPAERAGGCALERADRPRHAGTHIQAPYRGPGNRDSANGAWNRQQERVGPDRIDRPAQQLPAHRTILLLMWLGKPDPDAGASREVGGELRWKPD